MTEYERQPTQHNTNTIDIIVCGHELTVASDHPPHTITRCNKCRAAVCTHCLETNVQCSGTADDNLTELMGLRYQLRDKIGEIDKLLLDIYELIVKINNPLL